MKQPILDYVAARTFHGRQAEGVNNAFRYSVDYVLMNPEADLNTPRLFSRNRFNLFSIRDRDHGGEPGKGDGIAWVHKALAAHLPDFQPGRILLLAQPRVLGYVFNPVSFWLIHGRDGTLRAVIAEVTNTYGDRHSYLCHTDDLAPITRDVTLNARKVFHVSPFRPIEGDYSFRFDVSPERIGIWIEHRSNDGTLLATLCGPRTPLTSGAVLRASLRRPLGTRRVMALIHWQAVKLWWKGAAFRSRPMPPARDLSR
ncbi:MAG: DUF1365 domain-containing protein [Pseudomonadota bacterium]